MPDLSNTPDDAGRWAAAHAPAPAEPAYSIHALDENDRGVAVYAGDVAELLDADPLELCGTCEGSGEDGHDEWGCRTDCPACNGDGWAR